MMSNQATSNSDGAHPDRISSCYEICVICG